jgi:hypothetical protein
MFRNYAGSKNISLRWQRQDMISSTKVTVSAQHSTLSIWHTSFHLSFFWGKGKRGWGEGRGVISGKYLICLFDVTPDLWPAKTYRQWLGWVSGTSSVLLWWSVLTDWAGLATLVLCCPVMIDLADCAGWWHQFYSVLRWPVLTGRWHQWYSLLWCPVLLGC